MSERAEPLLSVVIAAYDMHRQLMRTLRSLSAPLQRGIEAGDYELLVVDNGSTPPVDLTECELDDTRVRVLREDRASPSPAAALNRGIAAARAPLIGAMIDGARMASPGLLHHALVGARAHERPVIGTLGFHLGAERQQEAVLKGYDERAEATLLESIDWPSDGYRLFDVATASPTSARGWHALPAESNALFMPRELWREVDGFDERFTSPGGGFVNLDLFARACDLPGIKVIMLLGEGTFHQVHGGVSTNGPASTLDGFYAEARALRTGPWERPQADPLYVGTLAPSALAAIRRSPP